VLGRRRKLFRIASGRASSDRDYRRVLPFRRSWKVIGLLAVMDAIFMVPAVLTLQNIATDWRGFSTLFDIVSTVFLVAWLVGWSFAPLILTLVLLVAAFGREVLLARPGQVEIGIGLPGLVLLANYDAQEMHNLRQVTPPTRSGHAWRGEHMLFDYQAREQRFGSAIDARQAAELRSAIEMATGVTIRHTRLLSEMNRAASQSPRERLMQRLGKPPAASDARHKGQPATGIPAGGLPLLSTLVLIIANLVPVYGALRLDWQLTDVMLLYWAESAIIGLFNLARMAVVGRWLVLVAGPLFVSHFAAFMAIHLLFIYLLFVRDPAAPEMDASLATVADAFLVLWPALLALLISHALSFLVNFIGRHEYRNFSLTQLMKAPYRRIVFMHLVIIVGGFVTLLLDSPLPALLGMIGAKLVMDFWAHAREHAADQPAS
jgi:hypothetical protein